MLKVLDGPVHLDEESEPESNRLKNAVRIGISILVIVLVIVALIFIFRACSKKNQLENAGVQRVAPNETAQPRIVVNENEEYDFANAAYSRD